MKTITRSHIALGAGLLSLSGALEVSGIAQAAPRDSEVRQERRDVKEAHKELKKERKDVRKAETAGERREERRDVKDARQDLREARQELRRERVENRPGYGGRPTWNNRPTTNRPNWNHRPSYNNRPTWNNQPNYNNNGNSSVVIYGVVLEDTSTSRGFRVRGGNGGVFTVSYNRGTFSRGQRVKIVGYRQNGLIVATDINRA